MKKPARPAVKSTRGNRTILVGLDVLKALSDVGGPAPLGKVAVAAQLSLSRAYRYLRALVDGGFVIQDKVSGHYDLGIEVLHLGLSAIGRVDPVRHALVAMRELTDRTGRATVLTIWGTNGPTVLRCEHGGLDIAFKIREGVNLPLLTTAAGKLFLSYLPPHVVQPILERELRVWNARHARKDAMTAAKVAALQQDVLRHGLSSSMGRFHPTHNLCAPVFDAEGRLRLSLTLISVAGKNFPTYDGPVAEALKATAEEVSRHIGHRPASPAAKPAAKRKTAAKTATKAAAKTKAKRR
ncbi:MAG TPA: helix-turn-helix domain-containing protein [Alphaproteobacteria bacterium]|jgi:DNA-binding IclR family transcriptional regulator